MNCLNLFSIDFFKKPFNRLENVRVKNEEKKIGNDVRITNENAKYYSSFGQVFF